MITFRTVCRFVLLPTMAALPLFGCAELSQNMAAKQKLSSLPTPEQATQPERDENASALRLARLLRDQGRYEGAVGVYAQLAKHGTLSPKEQLEYANVASLVYPPRTTLPLFMRAETELNKEETDLTAEERSELYTGLGRARLAVEQYELARQNLDKALQASPDKVAALNAMGVLLDAEGEHAQAQKILTRANELAPSDARILNNLALSDLSNGESRQAIKLFHQAKSLSDDLSIKLNLAFTYYMDGQLDQVSASLLEFMPSEQAEEFAALFGKMKQRVQAGESSIAEELLRASEKLIGIRPPVKETASNRDYVARKASNPRLDEAPDIGSAASGKKAAL